MQINVSIFTLSVFFYVYFPSLRSTGKGDPWEPLVMGLHHLPTPLPSHRKPHSQQLPRAASRQTLPFFYHKDSLLRSSLNSPLVILPFLPVVRRAGMTLPTLKVRRGELKSRSSEKVQQPFSQLLLSFPPSESFDNPAFQMCSRIRFFRTKDFNRDIFALSGHLAMSRDIFSCHKCMWRGRTWYCGYCYCPDQRPGMLLNIL